MKKLLTVCIPTYKRSATLDRCIKSTVSQINKYNLSHLVDVYVADDASPDNTSDVLSQYTSLEYFNAVSREVNLGMNVNIKTMFTEIKNESIYQLIITDDDYLQPDTLNEIVDFLRGKDVIKDVHTIWTPRYSYTEDDELHAVVCNPFNRSVFVKSSAENVGRHMSNGFVLSGLIIRAEFINYEFWEKYKENAYFPILFFGELLLQNGAYYWNKNIIHHTVLNQCHWERWGKNQAAISFRLFSDYVNAYSIMANHFNNKFNTLVFYFSSYKSIYHLIVGRLMTGDLSHNESDIYEAMKELKSKGYMRFFFQMKLMIFTAIVFSANISILKLLATNFLCITTKNTSKLKHYNDRIDLNLNMLKSLPILTKSVFN